MKLMASYISNDHETGGSALKMLTWPDSSLIRSGKPVFLDYKNRMMLHPGLGVRIKNVGKSIKAKFAERYYEELIPLIFILKGETSERIAHEEDPKACDLIADYSIIVGETLRGVSENKMTVKINMQSLYDNEEASCMIGIDNPKQVIASTIEEASKENTLKTGDIVGFLFPERLKAERDTLLTVVINDTENHIENKLK